jgi:hypothetical protein
MSENAGCLGALFGIFKPPAPPVVDPPKPPPTQPPTKITRDMDFRSLPPIGLARWLEITKGYPLEGSTEAMWRAVTGRPLPLAQSWMESRYGQDENAKTSHNPLGLFWDPTWAPGNHLDSPPLLVFPTWDRAFAEWARRMDRPGYKNGVYPQGMTLERFIRVYVAGPGPGYANGETAESVERYLTQTILRLERYYGITQTKPVPTGFKAHEVPGLQWPLWLPEDVGFRIRLTPMGVTGRKGKTLAQPYQVTRHTTNNYGAGTDAWHHAGWQAKGAQGNPGIAVHAYSDDKEVVIAMPYDEQGVHAGDWRNQQSVAHELTRHAGINQARAEDIAQSLDAAALYALGGNVTDNLYPHTRNAEGHCPDISIPWSNWEQRVAVKWDKLKGLGR